MFGAALLAIVATSHANAKSAGPAALADVLSCRAISQADARLACYDQSVASLESAADRKDVMVMDRQDIQKARRSLFGLSIPNLPFMGTRDEQKDDEDRELVTTAQTVTRDREGQWIITLPDGAVWQQTDQHDVFKSPHAGSKITIKRAALGSFFLSVDGQIGFRARRIS